MEGSLLGYIIFVQVKTKALLTYALNNWQLFVKGQMTANVGGGTLHCILSQFIIFASLSNIIFAI